MAKAAEVTVINRTRGEVFVELPVKKEGDKYVRQRLQVERAGEVLPEAKEVMLPGTPRHSLAPVKTAFKKADWDLIEASAAIKGMIAAGQIEVR